MAAPRATQFLALRNLSRTNLNNVRSTQTRSLHMTGPATYAATTPASKPSERSLRTPSHPASRSTRPLTTSQPMLQGMDYAYLPSSTEPNNAGLSAADEEAALLILRMPILPTPTPRSSPARHEALAATGAAPTPASATAAAAIETEMGLPTISPMSADAVVLPMNDLTDGHAMHVDFGALAENLGSKVRGVLPKQEQSEEKGGLVGRIWGDLVDDVLGVAGQKPRAAV